MKTGVHYGLDYAVYRTLPTHCHSEICAMAVDATVPLYPRGFRGHFQGNGVLCAENEGEVRDDKCIAVSKRSLKVMKMKKVKLGGTLMEIKTFVNMIMRSTEESN